LFARQLREVCHGVQVNGTGATIQFTELRLISSLLLNFSIGWIS